MPPLSHVFIRRSPQTAALLNDHAARLQQHRFSSQELRWGQQVKRMLVFLLGFYPLYSILGTPGLQTRMKALCRPPNATAVPGCHPGYIHPGEF